jgi:formate hydrogenlyase subunit 5
VIEQVRNIRITPDALTTSCDALLARGGQLHLAWGWFPSPGRIEVCYLASEPGPHSSMVLWRCETKDRALPSLTALAPALSWEEREISDLCGVRFDGHPKPFPLVLHEGAKTVAPPLDPDYPAQAPVEFSRHPARIPDVVGEDIQELPFGPVRADVLESAQFLFFYLGEHILHYQPRLFFKHRGMEQRFTGRDCNLGTLLAERVSGVGSVAHALAYCQAVEAACNCNVPRRARVLRVLLAELERIYNHLHYFGHLADTTTLKVGMHSLPVIVSCVG